MVDFKLKDRYDFADLLQIVTILRSPGGCAWDAEQTHQSIRRDFLEETYECCEAIDEDDPVHMCEELGDVLLQVLFHADIEREAGRFTIDDVCNVICQKLIFRHPHVFGDRKVNSSAEVLEAWDALKRVEKQQKSDTETLSAVARSLPALWRAEKLQSKAAKAGVRDADTGAAAERMLAAASSLAAAPDAKQSAAELGDLLFAAVGLGRLQGFDSEQLLGEACDRFIARFSEAEQKAVQAGGSLADLTPEQQAAVLSGR